MGRHISLEKEEEAQNERARIDGEDNLMDISTYGEDLDHHVITVIVS